MDIKKSKLLTGIVFFSLLDILFLIQILLKRDIFIRYMIISLITISLISLIIIPIFEKRIMQKKSRKMFAIIFSSLFILFFVLLFINCLYVYDVVIG